MSVGERRPPPPPPPRLPGPNRAPLGGEPLRLALAHLALLHHWRLVQMCTLAGLDGDEVASCLLDANDVSPLRSVATRNVALRGRTRE